MLDYKLVILNNSIMEISAISSSNIIDINTIREILSSNKIAQSKKIEFMRTNNTQIKQVLDNKLSGNEFVGLMKYRPLRKFKPLKNSFTKRGDKILLANALGIEPSQVDEYIANVQDALVDIDKLSFLPKDKLEAIKTYVYRHGTKDGIVVFLDYELKTSKDTLKTLYTTLDYHTNGLADYFIRPIHKMSNLTMIKLYGIIDKNLQAARNSGAITAEQYNKTAQWALIKIYQIQNNSKLINAVKTYNILK